MAGLHGLVRSAGPRDRAVAGAGAATPGRDVRRAAQGEVHGRSGAPAGQRSAVFADGGSQYRADEIGEGDASCCPSARIACAPSATDWKEFGGHFQIEHHSELLARLQDKLPAAAGERERVVFHDPCYLGRYRGVYDEPREVIARYGEVENPGRTRERSFCCGAGGGPDVSGRRKRQARERRARRRNWRQPARRWLGRRVRSARRCSATRWRRWRQRRRSCWTSRRLRQHRSIPRVGARWYNSQWRAGVLFERAHSAKPQENLKRARSSIGRASDS